MPRDTKEKVCKTCKRFVREDKCPICLQTNLSTAWKGLVYIEDPNSEVARALGITVPGKYCLFVR